MAALQPDASAAREIQSIAFLRQSATVQDQPSGASFKPSDLGSRYF
jgi:hypothetical protein